MRALVNGATILALIAWPIAASAQKAMIDHGSGDVLSWDPAWRRFGLVDGVVTGAAIGATVIFSVIGPDTADPQQARLGFDEAVRNFLRSDDYSVRRTWTDVSDVLVVVNLSYPYVADALINAAWHRNSPDVAGQLALLDTEVLAVTFGIQSAVANAVSRDRPYGRVCGTDELSANNVDCKERFRYLSYFSSHTALSFAAAAATCTHHAYVPLYGGSVEWLPCAANLALAGATSTARIAGDMHYATDVLTGAAVGSLVGWFVPWIHYATGRSPEVAELGSVRVTLVPTPGGIGAAGVF